MHTENVWAVIMENRIIGPFLFIDGPLNEPLRLQLLEEPITPTIIAALQNDGPY